MINKLLFSTIIFLHLPKTGGTSLVQLLQKKYKIFTYYKNSSDEEQLNTINSHEYDIITGHMDFNFINKIKYTKIFTIMRNPIQRCISLYYFVNKGIDLVNKELTLYEFFTSIDKRILRHIENNMTHQIAYKYFYDDRLPDDESLILAKNNIDKFDFVIIYENIDNDIYKYFNDKLLKYNVTPKYD
jgi:hypothetical protein